MHAGAEKQHVPHASLIGASCCCRCDWVFASRASSDRAVSACAQERGDLTDCTMVQASPDTFIACAT